MAKKKASDSRAEVLSAYQEVFKSKPGRMVLMDLMRNNFSLETTYDESPTKMAFYEGQRSVVLRLFATLKIDIKEFLKNINETNKPEPGSLWQDEGE